MIDLLYGKDEFTIFEKVKKMRDEITPHELRDINTTIMNGLELSLGELISAALTVPFMGEKRLVIVENLSARFESGFTDANKALGDWESIAVELDAIPPTTKPVFREGSPDHSAIGGLFDCMIGVPLGRSGSTGLTD